MLRVYNNVINNKDKISTPARVVLSSLTSLSDIFFLLLFGVIILIIIPIAIADNSTIVIKNVVLKILIVFLYKIVFKFYVQYYCTIF